MNERQREAAAREHFARLSVFDATLEQLRRHTIALAIVALTAVAGFGLYLAQAARAVSVAGGTLRVAGLDAPAFVRRDDRGVPHIEASSRRDLAFAQGFAEGSDRLFQMELTRRYAYGTLAEILGAKALAIDEEQRTYDVRGAAERGWRALGPAERADLEAFSDGVNAAMRSQPLPVEFALLFYRPQPWRPQDSLAVSLAVSIALADSYRDVLARNAVWRRAGPAGFERAFPLSDPRYDVAADGTRTPPSPRAPRGTVEPIVAFAAMRGARPGSNAWAAGSARTREGRALVANDPHLDLTIPGLWYLLDLRAPGVHVAGASIPGTPGVLLGHNERIAWAATNADAASASLFYPARLDPHAWKLESFHVRFGRDVRRRYYRTAREFGVRDAEDGGRLVLVRWPALAAAASAAATFGALDRAGSVRAALGVLARYRGTAENFAIADTGGNVAYHLAGTVVDDEAWGRYVHPARDLARTFAAIPFDALPSRAASREATVVSANNRMYGPGYPYRLAAAFDPPYRAYRIAQLLHARRAYDAAYFARMQLDTVSPADREFARAVAARLSPARDPSNAATIDALASWDGSFAPDSRIATLEHSLREQLEQNAPSFYALIAQLRDGPPSATIDADLYGTVAYAHKHLLPWAQAGSVRVDHPLAPLRFGFLNGPTLPGDGDEYTIHLQEPGFSQSFRAVWVAGDWDAGGIVIPSGESGEPSSPHYTDLVADWIAGRLRPLPFTPGAVRAATRETLRLEPRARLERLLERSGQSVADVGRRTVLGERCVESLHHAEDAVQVEHFEEPSHRAVHQHDRFGRETARGPFGVQAHELGQAGRVEVADGAQVENQLRLFAKSVELRTEPILERQVVLTGEYEYRSRHVVKTPPAGRFLLAGRPG